MNPWSNNNFEDELGRLAGLVFGMALAIGVIWGPFILVALLK